MIDALTAVTTHTSGDPLSAIGRSTHPTRRPPTGGAAAFRTVAPILISTLIILQSVVHASPANSATAAGNGSASTSSPAAASTGLSAVSDRELAALESRVRSSPSDGSAWRTLASNYVRRAYETADPSYYPMAANAIDRANSLSKGDPSVRVINANFLLALHDFGGARREANAALSVRLNDFDAKVALTDATIELGDYERAIGLVEELVDQRTGVASLSRLSYIRQLTGDIIGAEAAMRAAVSASPPGSLDRAVALSYLGDVLLERGRGDAAARAFRESLALQPYGLTAAMGMARILAHRGDFAGASKTLTTLVDRIPVPGALGLQAEIARANGDAKSAAAANQLVDASIDLFRANGAIVDAELAVLLADRGPASSRQALAAAERAYAARRTIFTADAKAWALYRAGQPREALPFIRFALTTNPAVASVHWHAALILHATGDLQGAREHVKLASRNPWFSIDQRGALATLTATLNPTP